METFEFPDRPKPYPWTTPPDGTVEVVPFQYFVPYADKLEDAISARDQRIADCEELLREIRDDEVNAEDEADKFLRGVKSSELSKARERIVTLESTIATTKSERDNVAKERDAANILLKRLMCIVVPDNVVPSDMKEFVRDSAKTVLKDLWEYLKTDADLRKAEHDTR